MKGNKSLYEYTGNKRIRQIWACCSQGVGDLVPKDVEKTKVLDDFFASDFIGSSAHRPPSSPKLTAEHGAVKYCSRGSQS